MATKPITIELSRKSIQNAIKELQKKENRIQENLILATQNLLEATLQALKDVFSDNNLSNHISSLNSEITNDGLGFRIWTNDWIVIFNEYGTGIKGTGTHPNPNGYQYNIKTEYKDELGRWVYKDKYGEFHTTSGMPAKYMFYDVEQMLKELAKDFYNVAISRAINDEQYQAFKTSLRG